MDRNRDHFVRRSHKPQDAEDSKEVLTLLLQPLHHSPRQLAMRLLEHFGSIASIANANEQELRHLEAADETWADSFLSVRLLIDTGIREDISRTKLAADNRSLQLHLFRTLGHQRQEQIVAFFADHNSFLLGEELIAAGLPNSVHASRRLLFAKALTLDASRMIIAHNHPSQSPQPSSLDISQTKDLARQARMLGITLDDHLIVTRNKIVSMKNRGLF